MTEEQRYRESISLERDKVKLLNRIAVAVETIAAGFNLQELDVFEADTNKLSDEDIERLVEADNKSRMINFGIDPYLALDRDSTDGDHYDN